MQSLFGHHGHLNLTTRLEHDIGIRQVGLKAVNAVLMHLLTPHEGVIAPNVDQKGRTPGLRSPWATSIRFVVIDSSGSTALPLR